MSARTTFVFIDWHEGILISRVAIDHIEQWFTALEASKVLAEQVDDLVPMIQPDPRRMWRDDDVREAPERASRIERFAFENVQNGPAEMAAPDGGNESRLIDDPSPRHINNDSAAYEPGYFLGANGAIDHWERGRRNYQNVAAS